MNGKVSILSIAVFTLALSFTLAGCTQTEPAEDSERVAPMVDNPNKESPLEEAAEEGDLPEPERPVELESEEEKEEPIINLEAIDQRIARLEDRAKQEAEEVSADFQKALESIKNKRSELERKVSDARESAEENWETAKAEARDAFEELKDAVSKLENSNNS